MLPEVFGDLLDDDPQVDPAKAQLVSAFSGDAALEWRTHFCVPRRHSWRR